MQILFYICNKSLCLTWNYVNNNDDINNNTYNNNDNINIIDNNINENSNNNI